MTAKRKAWQFPWSYRESIFVAIALFATGCLLQVSTRSYAPLPGFPVNLYLLSGFTLLIVLTKIIAASNPVVQWLSSVPAAIGSVIFLGSLSLVMGLVPQSSAIPPSDIFHNVTNSWPYFLSIVFLLTVLGFTIIKRIYPFRAKNIWFQFNHLGLWIVLAGASFGAGDMQRLRMETRLNEPVWIATDEWGRPVETGLALELKKFTVDFFPPAMSVYDFNSKKPVREVKPLLVDTQGVYIEYSGWIIKVEKYFSSAMWSEGEFRSFYGPGSVPAALISAKRNGSEISGWINPGNELNPAQQIMLNEKTGVILQLPVPRRYISDFKVYTESQNIYDIQVEVNSPAKVDGWRIYQVSYDDKMGRWSETSVVELNRDPWLPVVYTGLAFMILGALYMFISGFRFKEAEK